MESQGQDELTPSSDKLASFWKELWHLDTSPRMKMFAWTTCPNALPSEGALTRGGILFAAVKQSKGFKEVEVEAANAYLFTLQNAWEHGLRKTAVEGDCSSSISKLQSKSCPNNSIVLVSDSILSLAGHFDFCIFTHAKRMGNMVAHVLALLQPYSSSCWEWVGDGRDHIVDMALNDLCIDHVSD
ncbi:hypothetical protein Cgig2_006835 [Carnegiea gigantea]|uniref:RNase H type-1 domain-containing protein n=1 Tax=Carnegiea gigantea TaxID=171969 RepID=A0A9Q1JIW7_9CARY|nr:hypothetical protein Cgig2_006835 [Carnegiea gigantea]